ncbi:MAG: hypothetical protein AB7O60_05950 [Variibacter sp.]
MDKPFQHIATLGAARGAANTLSQNGLGEKQIAAELGKGGFDALTVELISGMRKFERAVAMRERATSDHYHGVFFAGVGTFVGLRDEIDRDRTN